jgi:CheY-like chemotaxis protein
MGLRLAIVADEPGLRTSISELLQSLACEVVLFQSGTELIEQLEHSRFSGVLLRLPPSDTAPLEVAKQIRASSLNGQAPIAVVSQPSAANEMRPAFDAGVNVFLSEPLQREAVRKALNVFVAPIARKRRRSPRVPFSVQVIGRYNGTELQLRSINVSEVGMLLEGSESLPFGDELELQFLLPGSRDPLVVPARVMRRDPQARLAVAFNNPPVAVQQRLQQFVSATASPSRRK